MKFNSLRYILRETFHSIRRNPWLSVASVLTIMVSLVILGFSIFFMVNADNMATTFESELEIAVFTDKSVTPQQLGTLKLDIERMPQVSSVTIVSKEQALVEFGKTMKSSGNNLLDDLGGINPFPDRLTVKAADPQVVKDIAMRIQGFSGVENVVYGKDFIDKLLPFTRWLRWVGIGVIVAFAIASIVLISINIKMNIFSRRREIQIMKLVGATNGFIRWPFFIEGMFLGLVGGLLASATVGVTYDWLSGYVQNTLAFLPVVQNPMLFWQVLSGLLVSGMAIGAVGTAISLRQFLKI